MIVKNEEALICAAIKSVKDFVSEIIICDTGSTDNTIAIAEGLGSQVVHYQWNDDFSAARNFALSHVRTPWTLWIDADDIVLNAECLQSECELARRHRIKGLWANYKQDESSYQRRMSVFKTKDFIWKGVVHESPIAKRPKITDTMYSELTILHRKPLERRPEAALKYLKILEAKDPENWFGIAESYRFLTAFPDDDGKKALYRANAEELFHRAALHPNVDPATKFIALFYCAKLNIEMSAENYDQERLECAVKLLHLCHSLEPDRAEPITLLGIVYESLNEREAAKACYLKAIEMPFYDRVGLVLKDYYRAIPEARLKKLEGKDV